LCDDARCLNRQTLIARQLSRIFLFFRCALARLGVRELVWFNEDWCDLIGR
jgi:hypothetical protein